LLCRLRLPYHMYCLRFAFAYSLDLTMEDNPLGLARCL